MNIKLLHLHFAQLRPFLNKKLSVLLQTKHFVYDSYSVTFPIILVKTRENKNKYIVNFGLMLNDILAYGRQQMLN